MNLFPGKRSMFSRISYYLDRFRYPRAKDFLSMGLGIEARYTRCARAWAPHLRLSREFVAAGLAGLPRAPRIAILGAGRLLDVPVEALVRLGGELQLFDADPGCQRVWRRLRGHTTLVKSTVVDLTGSIEVWSERLKEAKDLGTKNPDAIAQVVCELEIETPPELRGFDLVVSLNLLSQIPIYWRDRAEKILGGKLFEHRAVSNALERTYTLLQAAHLSQLASSGAPKVILITDERFFYYRNDLAPWQEERSLYVESLDLFGYAQTRRDSWYWHIIPQGIEERDFGSIHAVGAVEFRRD